MSPTVGTLLGVEPGEKRITSPGHPTHAVHVCPLLCTVHSLRRPAVLTCAVRAQQYADTSQRHRHAKAEEEGDLVHCVHFVVALETQRAKAASFLETLAPVWFRRTT